MTKLSSTAVRGLGGLHAARHRHEKAKCCSLKAIANDREQLRMMVADWFQARARMPRQAASARGREIAAVSLHAEHVTEANRRLQRRTGGHSGLRFVRATRPPIRRRWGPVLTSVISISPPCSSPGEGHTIGGTPSFSRSPRVTLDRTRTINQRARERIVALRSLLVLIRCRTANSFRHPNAFLERSETDDRER